MLANAKRSISRYPARGAEVSLISKMIIYSTYEVARPADIRLALFASCLVPVRRFPSPSRSIRFGDVSEANGRETHFRMDHVTRNALAARKNEA